MIVGLAGYAGAGKDTAAQTLVAAGYRQDSFAAPLKAMALACNPIVRGDSPQRLSHLVSDRGWEWAKTFPEVRRFLQRLGTDAVRNHLGEDVWANALMSRWYEADRRDTVVTDVRFPNEARAISDEYMAYRLIWIDRSGIGPVNSHASDQGLVRHLCTHEIVNDGSVEELHAKILEVVRC